MENKVSNLMASFKKVRTAYEHTFANIMKEKKLSMVEVSILGYLIDNEKDTAHDIENTLELKKSNVSISIECLIWKGYVVRKRDEEDRRMVHLVLTESGVALANMIYDLQKKYFISMFEGISQSDAETFFNVYKQLIKNVSE